MNDSHSVKIDTIIRARSLRAGFVQALYWAIMFGAGESSFALFAAHINAPRYFYGLLGGVPSLLGPLMQVAGANLLETYRHRKRMLLYSVAVQCLCFAPLALLPFFDAGAWPFALFCAALVLYYAAGSFPNPAWNSLISVLVPSAQRSDYFARLSRGVSIFSLVTKLTFGAAFYFASRSPAIGTEGRCLVLIFAAGFALSGLARFVSFCHIRRIYEPPYDSTPDAMFTFWQFIRRARESNFVHFVLFISLMLFATFLAAPFFLPYGLKTLGLQPWEWIAIDSAAVLASVITLLYWGRFSARFGNKITIQFTSYWIALVPLLWMFSGNLYYLIVVNAFTGVVWAGFNLSTFNYILEAVTPAKRARCIAYFNICAGLGIFSGSMVSSWLDGALPATLQLGSWSVTAQSNFMYLLVLSGAGRLLVALLFLPTFRELRQVQPLLLANWVFYIAQIRFPGGLSFDTLTHGPDGDGEDEAPAEKPAASETQAKV